MLLPDPADRRDRPVAARLSRRAALWTLLGGSLGAAGCIPLSIDHQQAALKPVLPPIVKPKDAVVLDVYFIERPAGDPLLGEALWRDLDEIGAVQSPEARSRLKAAGLRVGIAGSTAPPTLRAVVNEQPSASGPPTGGRQRVTLLSGQESTLEAAVIKQEFQLRTVGPSGETVESYAGARCILRVSATRPQEGWARLRFVPELHYGPVTLQPTADAADWKLRQGQQIVPLYEQAFDIELNLGEMVVVGATGRESDLVGPRFFRTGEAHTAAERIMIVRVVDLQKIEPVRSRDW